MTAFGRYGLSDAPADMASLIRCVAQSYARTPFVESVDDNRDEWITKLWKCYHSYGNYGAYCVVGSYAIISTAYDIASRVGKLVCFHNFPTAPTENSRNKERTLYGNVYRTYQEIVLQGDIMVGSEPEAGAMFFRASNDAGYNHAGIVIETPFTDDVWIRTVEANTSTSGGSGVAKGFVTIDYTKEAYDRYLNREFVRPADATKNYGGERLQGWRYAYFNRACQFTTPINADGFIGCPGVVIECKQPNQEPAPEPVICDTSNRPKPNADDALYTPWNLFSNEYPKRYFADGREYTEAGRRDDGLPVSMEIRPQRSEISSGDVQLSPDGCWVRYKISTRPSTDGSLDAEKVTECKDKLLLRSACDPDDGQGKRTVLRFLSKGDILTRLDLQQDKGAREALFSSVIPRDDFMSRGYSQRIRNAFDAVPMLQMDNCTVFNLVESSEMYKIFEQLQLWGPNPHKIAFDRTALGYGTGGGYAERLSGHYLNEEISKLNIEDSTSEIKNDIAPENVYRTNPFSGQREWWGVARQLKLTDYLERYDRSQANEKRSLVVIWKGNPVSGWDAIRGPLRVITGLVPGVGPLINQAFPVIDSIISGRATGVDVAFNLTNVLAEALGSGVLGDKPFGVDAAVFRDIASTASRAQKVYNKFTVQGATVAAIAMGVAQEFDKQFPEATQSLRGVFANEERWVRNAAADIERVWNGALGDIRSTVHGVAESVMQNKMTGLIGIAGGIDSAFASLLSTSNTILTSATQLPIIQEMLTTKPDGSLLTAVPGVNRVIANILGVQSFFQADVSSPATHAALAGIATGKRVLDGALDGMMLASLINKAEDFARKNWKFDLPATIPSDKRDCFAHEIRVVTGLECCAPKKQFCGVCLDPATVPPCPSGQRRDSDGCCVDVSRIQTSAETPSTGSTSTTQTNAGTILPVPSSIPSCIKVVGSRYIYCAPLSCKLPSQVQSPSSQASMPAQAPSPTTGIPSVGLTDEATIMMRTMNGAPVDIRARRASGTTVWTSFAIRPYMPSGNDWIPSNVTFQPIPASDNSLGVAITSDTFESMRKLQGAEISTTAALGEMLGLVSSETASVSTCVAQYEARFSPDPYDRWFARIGTTWVEIVDCCPKSEDTCCTETKSMLLAMRTDIVKLTELVLRIGEKEPLNLDDIRADIAALKETVQKIPQTKYDDTEVLKRLDTLQKAYSSIVIPKTYDDSVLRQDIRDMRTLVETRCKQYESTSTNYDRRFDDLEAMIRAIVLPPPIITPSGQIVQASTDYMPVLLELRRDIAELKSLTGTTYDSKFSELRAKIEAIPTTCPTCKEADLSVLRTQLDRIESNTSRNYDAEFANLRSVLEEIGKNVKRYDQRFDVLESLIRAIRVNETKDYTERFNTLEVKIAELRGILGSDRSYDRYFDAINERLDRLSASTSTSTSTGTTTPVVCDYRWDEALELLREIKSYSMQREQSSARVPQPASPSQPSEPSLPTLPSLPQAPSTPTEPSFKFDDWYARLVEKINSATERLVENADKRYDDLRSIVENMRSEIASRSTTTIAPNDPRIDDVLRLLGILQMTTSTTSASLQSARKEVASLQTNLDRIETAFSREIADLQTLIREQGGTQQAYAALTNAQQELAYQRERYEAEIQALDARLKECSSSTPQTPERRIDIVDAAPAAPSVPVLPSAPNIPLTPSAPSVPVVPSAPTLPTPTPVTPELLVPQPRSPLPSTPSEPGSPSVPVAPSVPIAPSVPDSPIIPETPVLPSRPTFELPIPPTSSVPPTSVVPPTSLVPPTRVVPPTSAVPPPVKRSRPSEEVPTDGECPDCPVMVETHKRVYYRYPTTLQRPTFEATAPSDTEAMVEDCDAC